jgi:hypothetical protein
VERSEVVRVGRGRFRWHRQTYIIFFVILVTRGMRNWYTWVSFWYPLYDDPWTIPETIHTYLISSLITPLLPLPTNMDMKRQSNMCLFISMIFILMLN